MIDVLEAIEEFKNYVEKYNMQLDGINRKYSHSFRVMNISKEIAKSLKLKENELNLATIIGLLHDIARFEEYTRFNKFAVENKFDHGDYALEILKENNYIRKFIKTDLYDSIIFKAIKNHNKFMIEDGLDEKTLLFSKIIRDADKIDILYEATEMFWKEKKDKEIIENDLISDDYIKQFIEKKLILRMGQQSKLDQIVAFIAFIFDINFRYSFYKIKEEDYINRILNRFNFKNKNTIIRIDEIRSIANAYINENI